jgi:hypothetical protein
MTVPVIGEVIGQAIRDAVDGLVTPLREQLEVANQRAQDDRKRADAAISTERDRADRAERRADGERATAEKLQAELIDLRVSERIADRAVAEVLELRQRLDQAATAERVARTEADDLRAVLDTRQQWGLARRLRWALRGR